MFPYTCCVGVKCGEAARSLHWRVVRRGQRCRRQPGRHDPYASRRGSCGVGLDPRLKVAEGRRAGLLWGQPPRRPSDRGSPGAGANQRR